MILKNSLYTIADKRMEGSGIFYQILLDKNHFIYKAHFPNEPITPGVCIIQIAKELFCRKRMNVRLKYKCSRTMSCLLNYQ